MLIKKEIKVQDIRNCIAGNGWGFGNSILYEMCSKNPKHENANVVVAKVWLIGRSYSAAIERRKNASQIKSGDDFYFDMVAPKILEIGGELDNRIDNLKKHSTITRDLLIDIVKTHLFLTKVFSEISGQDKRSLASKYLHFHVPDMFYIYDSRAIKEARSYVESDKNLKDFLAPYGDKEYIEIAIRLFAFQEYVNNQYGLTITPRQIDSFLLGFS